MDEQPGGLADDSPVYMLIGLGLLAAGATNLVAIALAVAGLFQSERTKTFAIVGLLLAGLEMLSVVGLIVLGSAIGN